MLICLHPFSIRRLLIIGLKVGIVEEGAREEGKEGAAMREN